MRSKILILLIFFSPLKFVGQQYIPGYSKELRGEELIYHAPQPDAPVSLLVRSEDSARFIEWESVPIPGIWNLEFGIFLMLAGIDVNPDDPHSWKVFVNDREMFTISSPTDTLNKTLTWPGPDGSSLVFKTKEVDKYGDFMGYLYVNLPVDMLETGKPARFKVVGENTGSRTWFMVFKYATTDQVRLVPEQAIMKGDKGNYQVLRAEIIRYASPVDVKMNVAGNKINRHLDFGYNVLYLPVPEINEETDFNFTMKAGKNLLADTAFHIRPVTPRTIYLLHHSHHDIGYTHVQPEVEEIQRNNLDQALALIDSTKNFPEGAKFKWCTEVMWSVGPYIEKASQETRQAFIDAVRSGSLELNGLYANELVSLCGPEELDRLLESGRRIARECGVGLTTAMITDIPGWSWALVPALAHSEVKYLSLGTNRGHRIGNIIDVWGDRPFYWVSPSGDEKVLCWIHGEGYSLFHTGLAYNSIRNRLQEDLIFGYLKNLSVQNYPYNEVMLRYNIGSDNGPVDLTLPAAVRDWNEKYVTPKIVISTVQEAFSAFEQKHGNELPGVSGDLTCYWEDGAYSTARETIQNRRNASRLLQAQSLWAMFNPAGYPEEAFREAWRNVLLFDEHTWGSWNSISEPEIPFTLQQWEIKKSFATEAEKQSKKLFKDAMTSKILGGPVADAIEVINTCSWKRSGLITIAGGAPGQEIRILDAAGEIQPVQALSDGTLLFLAKDVPPLSSKIYKLQNHPITQSPNHPIAQLPSRPIETDRFIISIDTLTGAISSLSWKNQGMESLANGLNEYLYVKGRMPSNPLRSRLKKIQVTESGPLLTLIEIEAEAPGSKSLITTIRIIDQLDQVEITNTVDREKIYEPEALRFAFPFNIPGGVMRYDLAYGYCQTESDQAPGSNKNFITMEHWLDISNENSGVTVICPDAPLFEAGRMTMDEIVYGWVDSIPATQTFFSYAMNNYWETNFAAAQEGPCTFRYIIRPHEGFDPARAEKEAISQRQSLILRKGGGWRQENPSPVTLQNESLVITAIKPIEKGTGLLLTIYNAGFNDEIPIWGNRGNKVFLTDPDGISETASDGVSVPPGGFRHFIIKL